MFTALESETHPEGHITSKNSQPVTGIEHISGGDSQDEKGDDMRQDGWISVRVSMVTMVELLTVRA